MKTVLKLRAIRAGHQLRRGPVTLADVHSTWIICGHDLHTSSYVRLHIEPLLAHLARLGHPQHVFQQADKSWSTDDVPTGDLLVLVKVDSHTPDERIRAVLDRARSQGAATVGVLQQRGDIVDQPLTWDCDQVVCSWPAANLLAQAQLHGKDLLLTPDPWDDWVPDTRERDQIQRTLGADRPLTLLSIARRRHLAATHKLAAGVPDDWRLAVITDQPRAGHDDTAWDVATARRMVCEADALLIAATGENSAPIRLLTALRSGCPAVAHPLPSYVSELAPNTAWLAVTTPAEVARALIRMRDPLVRRQMSEAGAPWRRTHTPPDPLVRWLEILRLAGLA